MSHRSARVVLAIGAAAALAVAVLPPDAAASPPPTSYREPVEAPVTDTFRPPPHPYGPGNRGLEYATRRGAAVRAVAAGHVVFAGAVAGRLVVSIVHPDGLRSSLTGLAKLAVAAGAEVAAGDVVGLAGHRLHLGIRQGDTYLDPGALFAATGEAGRVHLVPLGRR